MYETTESQYVATTTPRTATTAITHNSAYESLLTQHQTEQQQQHQQKQQHHKIEAEQPQNIYKEYRPTYGAYINNTLPRGPYLQYKFNDQQSAYSKRNDNNQKNRQIELLKHEFMVLPRAKIKISGIELPSPTNNNNNNCFNGIQTLGRHRYTNRSNRPTSPELSSFDYYNKNEPTSCWRDNSYGIMNQSRNDKTTKLVVPNSEAVNTFYKRNSNRFESSDNGTANADYICNYNHEPVTKNGYKKTADIEKRNVLRQPTESEYFDVATDLNNFSTKTEPVRYASGTGRCNVSRVNSPINYVTLFEIMKAKENGFSQVEGWAILCQSIQALQDLFLADTPSTNRLLPLVNLTNLQITSRGRVVFNVMPAGQMNSDNDVTPFSDTSFLSPEYLNNIGKKTSFSESDIEKMWIYSLGITLYKAIPSTSGITPTNRTISGSLTRINNDRENDDVAVQAPVPSTAIRTDMTMYHHSHSNELDKMLTSLDCVISAMCAPKLHNRASLMYLLDVISEYCRCHHQIKPFSHIVMDLFQEALEKVDINASISVHLSKMAVNRKTTAVDNRSDTDSGNSSAQGDRDIYALYNKEMERNNKKVADKRTLKVSRTATDEQRPSDAPFNKFNPIGFSAQSEMEEKPLEPTKRLQVTRRRDEILKRRNRSRRNTIAVNLLDVNKCSKELQSNVSWDGSCSKSTNCIDKIAEMEENGFAQKIDELQLNGCSMPELNGMKFSTLPNLKVRRTKETANSNQSINQLAIIKSIGPEFIANSSLSPLAIDITDAKITSVSNKRAVIVLLLNGKSIKIICNPAATTAQEIFETVIKCENFVENFFLGICALIGGDFVFLPPDLKIHKVAPEIWFNAAKKGCYTENVIFTLFLRTKFFLPTLRGIGSLESRHLLYLQLRKSILESHILCNDEELISLGGLALQSEIGDFTESMKHTDYFTISHYLPEGVYQRNKGMAKYLRSSHFSKKGLQSRESEYNFIRYVQEMKEYGLHLFSAVWSTDDGLTYDVYVAVSLSGIRVFKRSSTRHDQSMENSKWSKTDYQRTLYANFEWLEIENLCFSKHILCVVIRKSESLKAKDNNRVKYKFRMDGRKSYFAFHLASEHHRFYMKLRNSFISLKALSDELNYPLNGGMNRDHTVPIPQQTDHSGPIIDHFLHKIEQPHPIESSNKSDKPADGRVGKLKKSMLNDNRLLKLRNKFLKRSKSSVSKERICLNPNGHSMEENQNKENECPKIELPKQSQNLLLSPNRNRVKMGTRVFSAQFLNKSFDNVSDSNGFNMYRFDSNDGLDAADAYPGKTCTFERDLSDDGMSLTSTSLSSLYYSEKMSEKFSPSPLPTEAYVIQASMKSNCDINQFSMFNETISDSLFEKFNNLSKNNTIGDRIINRITIVKDSFAKIHSSNGAVVKGHRKYSLDSDGGSSIEDNSLANKFTLGISIIQGSDNNVYVKDLVKNGPGERGGIEIGDQILAVNGTSLLNLSYDQSLQILQNTGTTVELTVSQIYKKSAAPSSKQIPNVPTKISTVRNITRSMKNSFKFKKDRKTVDRTGDTETNAHRTNNLNENDQNNGNPSYGDAANWNCKNGNDKTAFKVRSMPDLPKVVGTIPKHQTNDKGTLPRTMGLSRKYVGPVRYPVTPIRPSNGTEKQRLSLLADNVDKQVFI